LIVIFYAARLWFFALAVRLSFNFFEFFPHFIEPLLKAASLDLYTCLAILSDNM